MMNRYYEDLNKEFNMGREVELEHEGTFNYVISQLKKGKKVSLEEFVSRIAEDHLTEDEKYYTKLKSLEL